MKLALHALCFLSFTVNSVTAWGFNDGKQGNLRSAGRGLNTAAASCSCPGFATEALCTDECNGHCYWEGNMCQYEHCPTNYDCDAQHNDKADPATSCDADPCCLWSGVGICENDPEADTGVVTNGTAGGGATTTSTVGATIDPSICDHGSEESCINDTCCSWDVDCQVKSDAVASCLIPTTTPPPTTNAAAVTVGATSTIAAAATTTVAAAAATTTVAAAATTVAAATTTVAAATTVAATTPMVTTGVPVTTTTTTTTTPMATTTQAITTLGGGPITTTAAAAGSSCTETYPCNVNTDMTVCDTDECCAWKDNSCHLLFDAVQAPATCDETYDCAGKHAGAEAMCDGDACCAWKTDTCFLLYEAVVVVATTVVPPTSTIQGVGVVTTVGPATTVAPPTTVAAVATTVAAATTGLPTTIIAATTTATTAGPTTTAAATVGYMSTCVHNNQGACDQDVCCTWDVTASSNHCRVSAGAEAGCAVPTVDPNATTGPSTTNGAATSSAAFNSIMTTATISTTTSSYSCHCPDYALGDCDHQCGGDCYEEGNMCRWEKCPVNYPCDHDNDNSCGLDPCCSWNGNECVQGDSGSVGATTMATTVAATGGTACQCPMFSETDCTGACGGKECYWEGNMCQVIFCPTNYDCVAQHDYKTDAEVSCGADPCCSWSGATCEDSPP